jgi:hypothetical protein
VSSLQDDAIGVSAKIIFSILQPSNQGIHVYRHGDRPECLKIFGPESFCRTTTGKHATDFTDFTDLENFDTCCDLHQEWQTLLKADLGNCNFELNFK